MEDFISMNCFKQTPQTFLVSATVYQARDLNELNITTFVKVTFNNKEQTTRQFNNSENPFYNEYFVFEICCTLTELLHYNITFEVKKKMFLGKKTIGQFSIDLETIWKQANHSFFKKWGRLENPLGSNDSPKPNGHLLIDICILTKDDVPAPIKTSSNIDNIEMNLLKPKFDDLSTFKCHLIIYKGMFVTTSNYFIQVTASGNTARTRIVKNAQYAEWNEVFAINWCYPSLSEKIFIEVMSTELFKKKRLSYFEINLNQIKFSETDLMTLGPTYIHFYEPEHRFDYIGRLLIEIECNKLEKIIPRTEITLKLINPIMEKAYWRRESFLIECLIWCGDFIHTCSNRIEIYMKCGESMSNQIDFNIKNYNNTNSLKYFFASTPFRALYTYLTYPDIRLKNYTELFVKDLYENTQILLEDFSLFNLRNYKNDSSQKNYLAYIINEIIVKLKYGFENLEYNEQIRLTEYDKKKIVYLKEFVKMKLADLGKFSESIDLEKNIIESVVKYLKSMCDKLENIINYNYDIWPNLYIVVKVDMEDIAVCTLNPKDYIHHDLIKYRGKKCGKRNQLVFKLCTCQHSCKYCGCIFGKLDACLWVGTQFEYDQIKCMEFWERLHPYNYNLSTQFDIVQKFQCKVYIYQAKIKPGHDQRGACNPRVSVTFINYNKDTSTIEQTCLPIWNEAIIFEGIVLPGTWNTYSEHPLLLAITMFDKNKLAKDNILGIGLIPIQLSKGKISISSIMENTNKKILNETSTMLERIRSKRNSKDDTNLADEEEIIPPILKWVKITKNGCISAQVLMSCEIIKTDEENLKNTAVLLKNLPPQIIPKMKKFLVEVVFIGLREWSDLTQIVRNDKYKIQLTIGDLVLTSGPSGDKLNKSVNFSNMYASGVVHLPEQLEYWSSMIITHLEDQKTCTTSVGISSIQEPEKFLINASNELCFLDKISFQTIQGYNKEKFVVVKETGERTNLLSHPKRIPSTNFFKRLLSIIIKNIQNERDTCYFQLESNEEYEEEENVLMTSWWTKFYYSQLKNRHDNILMERKHELVIYESELENQPEFEAFHDWAKTYNLYEELKEANNAIPSYEHYAKIKMNICIKDNIRNNDTEISVSDYHIDYDALAALGGEINVLARVYVIRAYNLRSYDKHSAANPFIKVSLGCQCISDVENYIINQSNPIFGKMFEVDATIPHDHILYIAVYDHGKTDVLIGETEIDLEDRLKSKYHANVGIPKEYNSDGYNVWRDIQMPHQILKNICTDYFIENPEFVDQNTIVVDGITFNDSSIVSEDLDFKERLSLSVLNRLRDIPRIGYNLVPEHVETRSLYRCDRPGIEQGKLQLWVDIFESENVPNPVHITPMPAKEYEIRIIIYRTESVRLADKNVFGQKMSDIYVKGWFNDKSRPQRTDVHFRSKTCESKFNWRMKFYFLYSEAEHMTIIKKKEKFHNECREFRQPPILILQIWDKDVFSVDDLLGTIHINLGYFEMPYNTSKECSLNQKERTYMNLFKEKHVRGWFPCKGFSENKETICLGGKIELDLQLLTEENSEEDPAGYGREPPKALPEPDRSCTSFNPLTHPMKAVKYIISPYLQKAVIVTIGCIVITLAIFVYVVGDY